MNKTMMNVTAVLSFISDSLTAITARSFSLSVPFIVAS